MGTSFETLTGRVQFTSPNNGYGDSTPPTFAGIVSATPENDGSIMVTYALATGTKLPIDYHVYIALGSVDAATLFNSSNVTLHIPPGKTQGRVFLMPDEATYLVKGQQYTLGIRSNDAFGFEDSNTAIQVVTAIASGNLPAVLQSIADQTAATEVLLAADEADFDADLTRFETDLTTLENTETDLAQDHTDLHQDHLDIHQDHLDLAGDHADLAQDHLNIAQDHLDLVSDHTNFQSDHSDFQDDHANFEADIAALGAIVGNAYVPGALNLDIQENIMDLEIISEQTEL